MESFVNLVGWMAAPLAQQGDSSADILRFVVILLVLIIPAIAKMFTKAREAGSKQTSKQRPASPNPLEEEFWRLEEPQEPSPQQRPQPRTSPPKAARPIARRAPAAPRPKRTETVRRPPEQPRRRAPRQVKEIGTPARPRRKIGRIASEPPDPTSETTHQQISAALPSDTSSKPVSTVSKADSVQRSKMKVSLPIDREALRKAILYREILRPPRAIEPYGRSRF